MGTVVEIPGTVAGRQHCIELLCKRTGGKLSTGNAMEILILSALYKSQLVEWISAFNTFSSRNPGAPRGPSSSFIAADERLGRSNDEFSPAEQNYGRGNSPVRVASDSDDDPDELRFDNVEASVIEPLNDSYVDVGGPDGENETSILATDTSSSRYGNAVESKWDDDQTQPKEPIESRDLDDGDSTPAIDSDRQPKESAKESTSEFAEASSLQSDRNSKFFDSPPGLVKARSASVDTPALILPAAAGNEGNSEEASIQSAHSASSSASKKRSSWSSLAAQVFSGSRPSKRASWDGASLSPLVVSAQSAAASSYSSQGGGYASTSPPISASPVIPVPPPPADSFASPPTRRSSHSSPPPQIEVSPPPPQPPAAASVAAAPEKQRTDAGKTSPHPSSNMKTGYLYKKGRGKNVSFVKPWTYRWCALDINSGILRYYSETNG
jgi:hypothetical protein